MRLRYLVQPQRLACLRIVLFGSSLLRD